MILIVDTATDNLFVRFYDEINKKLVFEKEMISHNNHSENLLTTIEEGLNTNNLELNSFDKIIVGKGPGSYTGLRISMVVCKMAAYTLNKDLYTISSLSLCGSGYFNQNGTYAIVIKAKKDYSYLKIVNIKDSVKTVLVDDIFLPDTEMNELVKANNAIIIGSNDYKLDDEKIIEECELVDNIHDLVPNYLRKANS